MRGYVSADREILLSIKVRGLADGTRTVTTVVDTGFDGHLTLPFELVDLLGLRYLHHGRATLADGTTISVPRYEATIEWDEQWKRVVVSATGDVPLLGMEVLEGHRLTVDVVHDGAATIVALSEV